MCRHPTPEGRRPQPNLTTSQANPVTPTVLPSTKPSPTPSATLEVTASIKSIPARDTPALARANTGTMTKALQS